MASGVFVLKDKDTLVPMEAARFASEDDFQSLLAKFPELLSGDQIDPSSPRKWILVRREKAVPSEENGGDRWSLDHLFLDQDGVPTLVEVKRQTDPRIRREVVGQMLDYAANCVVYWPVEGLQTDLEVTSAAQGKSSAEALSELLGPEASEAEFWLKVKTNLEAGRIRLLFVADAIPSELRRIIEFLNKQMDPAEVLGVELRQFEGQGLRTLVPLVVGQTQEAAQKRNPAVRQNRHWDKASILAEIQSRFSEPELKVARRIAEWMKGSGGRLWFGTGQRSGSMGVIFTSKDGVELYPIILWTYGRIEIQFQWMKGRPFFDELENRRELMRRLNEIDGVNISNDDLAKRPSVPLSTLSSSPSNIEKFMDTLNWIVDRYRSS
jgi:hypothetical protein